MLNSGHSWSVSSAEFFLVVSVWWGLVNCSSDCIAVVFIRSTACDVTKDCWYQAVCVFISQSVPAKQMSVTKKHCWYCCCHVWAPGHDAPLIRFLISALYILFACLYRMLSYLSFFHHFFLAYLLPYLSLPLRIDPLRFPAGCHKRRLNLALVFCVVVHLFWLVNVCFCCVRFSFFNIASQEIGLGKRLSNDLFCFEWDVKPQLSQSILMLLLLLLVCMSAVWTAAGCVCVFISQSVPVKQTSVTKKKDSLRAMALDSDNNQIQVKDIVKVVDGPHSVSHCCYATVHPLDGTEASCSQLVCPSVQRHSVACHQLSVACCPHCLPSELSNRFQWCMKTTSHSAPWSTRPTAQTSFPWFLYVSNDVYF